MGRGREPDLNALLGQGAYYTGDMAFEGRVRLDGHFSGRVYTEERLEIGELGLMEGEVDAAEVVIAGRMKGRLKVRRRLVIESTAHVEGEIDARLLEIEAGATIRATVNVG